MKTLIINAEENGFYDFERAGTKYSVKLNDDGFLEVWKRGVYGLNVSYYFNGKCCNTKKPMPKFLLNFLNLIEENSIAA